jgi:4-azaleucine resistance transporter AzlC
MDRRSFEAGIRGGTPYAVAGILVSMSFGVIATDAGFSALEALIMSMVVFAGSAQFAAISIVASGGAVGAAIVAATLMNSRFLAMGIAFAGSLPGGPFKRALQGQTVVDSSWAMASRGDGTFDRWFLFGATVPQYVTWSLGTLAGALGGDILGDTDKLGLDAVFPAFFVALLIAEVRSARSLTVAALGAIIALALVPVTPAGVPVLVASLAVLAGIRE